MNEDLHTLGEDLITTSARVVRWVPKSSTFTLSLAAARILARLSDNGPTRISELAVAERCSQPTITNHIKRLEAAGLVARNADVRDARAWMIELTPEGREQLATLRDSLGTGVEPYLARLSRRDLKALREGVDAMRRLMALDA
ncbi:DNA-binding transcriptional regulator, MarR family [Friedmanniella luteola]|uniref:DNA-binding transcriptional regulator, MarR family n=1 Tax=Friedmanniella luteola TaxID=546871 RepID=A0A1H1M3F0_9ACTN|nr:MarR family transcriptional regulator [Friedmanniella luteola]SDR80549.1 DNA-binding transcriptional regulator, MarR family [Friedmanniella luteola]